MELLLVQRNLFLRLLPLRTGLISLSFLPKSAECSIRCVKAPSACSPCLASRSTPSRTCGTAPHRSYRTEPDNRGPLRSLRSDRSTTARPRPTIRPAAACCRRLADKTAAHGQLQRAEVRRVGNAEELRAQIHHRLHGPFAVRRGIAHDQPAMIILDRAGQNLAGALALNLLIATIRRPAPRDAAVGVVILLLAGRPDPSPAPPAPAR